MSIVVFSIVNILKRERIFFPRFTTNYHAWYAAAMLHRQQDTHTKFQLSREMNQTSFFIDFFWLLAADNGKTRATSFDLKGCQNLYRLARLKALLLSWRYGQGCSPTAKDSCLFPLRKIGHHHPN
jgi:hypothetical protein